MLQRDYLLRQIEHFTRKLTELMLQKEEQRFNNMDAVVNEELKAYFGADLKLFLSLPFETFADFHKGNVDVLKFLAELLHFSTFLPHSNSDQINLKLIDVYLELSSHYVNISTKLIAVLKKVEINQLSLNLSIKVIRCLMDHHSYNEAENLIFKALFIHKNSYELIVIAESFYKRLKAKDEDELKRYQFSKIEIEEGMRDLKTYMYSLDELKYA